MTIQQLKEKISAAQRGVLVGDIEPWLTVASQFGLADELAKKAAELSATLGEYLAGQRVLVQNPRPEFIKLRSFPQEVRCRAGVVYRLALGQKPKGHKAVAEFLQTLHPAWKKRYPVQGAMLEKMLAPTRDARINWEAAEQAVKAAEQAWKTSAADLEDFKTSLVQRLWDEAIELVLPYEVIVPDYSSGQTPSFRSGPSGSYKIATRRSDPPPVGSPIFLADLKAKLEGKPVRIFEPAGRRPVTGPEITLGEEGRGRQLVRVPIVGAEKGEEVISVNIGIAGNLVALKAANPDTPVNENFVLVVLDFNGGCRGDVEYSFPERSVRLATGYVAQGIAGRAGGWGEELALLPTNSEVAINSSGGGGHIGGTRWLRILNDGVPVVENKSQREERLARQAAEEGSIQWL